MPTVILNPAAGERLGRVDAVVSWTLARDAASSSSNFANGECSSQLSALQYYNYRTFIPFLASFPAGAVPISAILGLYRDDTQELGGNGFLNADTTTAVVVASTQASGTSYANSDYSAIAFVSKGSINFSATTNNTYFSIPITDMSIIPTSGYIKLCVITGRDLANSSPTGANDLSWQNRSQANPPKLTVTFSLPGGGPIYY